MQAKNSVLFNVLWPVQQNLPSLFTWYLVGCSVFLNLHCKGLLLMRRIFGELL